MSITRLVARPMLASIFVVGGLGALKGADARAAKARRVTDKVVPLARKQAIPLPSDPATLVRLNAATQILAGAALATGRAPRASAAVLAATMVPTTIAGHAFWDEDDAQTRDLQRTQFVKNVSILGGLLLAGVDTAGKPGLAWRARRLAKDARREAQLAHARLT